MSSTWTSHAAGWSHEWKPTSFAASSALPPYEWSVASRASGFLP